MFAYVSDGDVIQYLQAAVLTYHAECWSQKKDRWANWKIRCNKNIANYIRHQDDGTKSHSQGLPPGMCKLHSTSRTDARSHL